MLQSVVLKFAKKYILKAINDLLAKKASGEICKTLLFWATKLLIIVEEFKKIASRASDGVLDSEETENSISEIQQIIKDW